MHTLPLKTYLKGAALVTRQGKAVAVLVSAEDWESYLRLKKENEMRGAQAIAQAQDTGQVDTGSENGGELKDQAAI